MSQVCTCLVIFCTHLVPSYGPLRINSVNFCTQFLPSYKPCRINFVNFYTHLLIWRIAQYLLSYRPGRINIAQLDPSLSLAFLCKTEQEFDNLCIGIQVRIDGVDKNTFASEGQTTGLHFMLFCCFELFFYSGGGVETVFCSSL